MDSVAALVVWNRDITDSQMLACISRIEPVRDIAAIVLSGVQFSSDCAAIHVSGLWSRQAILDSLEWFDTSGADHLLIITSGTPLLNARGVRRMVSCLQDTGASIVYGDYHDVLPDGSVRLHPLIDYQPGSIRDSFDFGPVFLLNGRMAKNLRTEIQDSTPELAYGGLYDLRLRLTERGSVVHLPEPLYSCPPRENAQAGHFDYVDPRNREYQIEMEKVATAHLGRIGALIQAPKNSPVEAGGEFRVRASVVVPVRNRARTIRDAVKSALSQKTAFDYNVIVVDNHSTDGTTEILTEIAATDSRLVHLIPERTDLLIGGCWNEAVYSDVCGMYAVQLDSDDIYRDTGVLQRIIDEFDRNPCALVIGSYTTVNFDLQPLAPGLIDHREWTDTNGFNNALRIAGLGAPRAYHVPTLRQFGFPNVSYGEDYAVVLRLCRSYPVGRIFESLYWCRRWEENSDSALPLETANRYDLYKDRLRTIEIAARISKEGCR